MKLAVSNIAWCNFEDEAIVTLLSKLGVKNIEAAPAALARQATASVTIEYIAKCRRWWSDRGFSIPAFQALLFGYPEFQLIGSHKDREDLFAFLQHVISLAEICGTKSLVFGSPKNRLRNGLSESEANDIAADFFFKMGIIAANSGCKICLEPNAVGYGCDFMTHLADTASLVRRVNSPGIGLQLDTGVMLMNNESVDEVRKVASEITHVHCSHPFLEPLSPDVFNFHKTIAEELVSANYTGIVSIEMKRANDENNEKHVRDAVQFVQQAYKCIL